MQGVHTIPNYRTKENRTPAQMQAALRNIQLARKGLGVPKDYRKDGENSKLEGALFGDLDPRLILKREQPVHRTMINMAAAGYTVGEISALTGRGRTTVHNVLHQPSAREHLINEAKKTVQDELKAILEREALPSIKTLVEVRDNPNARSSDRVTASNSLLDRFLGKPTQPITTNEKPVEQLSNDELTARANAVLSRFSSLEGAKSPTDGK